MDVSICLAGFRTPRWTAFLDSIKESCKKYTYEVIIAGPFEPPTNLPIKFIKTYACPSTAQQMASGEATGDLHYLLVDDALLHPDALDKAVDLFYSLNDDKAIINMRYTEGHN